MSDANHLKAFGFSALMMLAAFPVVPYIAIQMQFGVGLRSDQLPYIYLCGGLASIFTARLFGQLTDRWGKVQSYRLIALLLIPCLFALTLLPLGTPLWLALLASTLLMICGSGRMIPAMAIVTSAANPALRGTFMSLNSAVQSAAMGAGAFVGGSLISRDATGQLQNFWQAALFGSVTSLLGVWLAGRLDLHFSTVSAPLTPPERAPARVQAPDP